MADNDGFYEAKGKRNIRQVVIGNVSGLCNTAGEKRIKVPVQMTLSGRSNAGSPEWLDAAYIHASKFHQKVDPEVEFQGYEVRFDSENLFGDKAVGSTKCRMRSFTVLETGDSEKPDVSCFFVIYMPWSGKLWKWLGEYIGEDVWARFTPIAEDQQPAEAEGDDPSMFE